MIKRILLASAVVAAFASNAQSAPFGVTGTVAPSSCTLTLSGGGMADYGAMTFAAVKSGALYNSAYNLVAKSIPISVTCGAATSIQLAFIDNMSAQRFPLDTNDPIRFGIANGSSTAKFGAYAIGFTGLSIDGAPPAGYLSAPAGTSTWAANLPSGYSASFAQPGNATGFTKVSTATVPDTLATLTGNLTVYPLVSKAAVDAATSTITLNGSGTITLQYQ